jgi:DNA repair exonuclease SbcCD ATPase subunit
MPKVKRKWPNAVYAGSLIQQNHGEDLGHGYYVWDVDSEESEYVEIPNDYGHYTINVSSGAVPITSRVPKKPHLRLKVKNTEPQEMKKLSDDVRRLYDVQRLSINRIASEAEEWSQTSETFGDVSSLSYQNELITDYVKRNFIVDDELISEIQEINRDVNRTLDEEKLAKNIKWEPLKFEFSNMFSYGEDNVINFEKMGGIVGVFAENASGKSSILDALCYCLFDRSTRARRSSKVLNNKKNWFECRFSFLIDDTKFVIHRKAEKQSDGRLPVKVNFYRVEKDGTKTSLNGEQRYYTNKIIEEYVGTFDDFILTALSVQNNNTIFIEKSQTERKDLLAQFMGIDVFDELYSIAKDKSRDIKSLLKEYSKEDLNERLKEVQSEHSELKSEYNSLKGRKGGFVSKKRSIMEKIMDLNKEIKKVEDFDTDVDSLKERYVSLNERVEELQEQIKAKQIKVRERQQAAEGLKSFTKDVNGDDLENRHERQIDLKSEIESANQSLSYTESKLKDLKKAHNHLNHKEFDPDCRYCVQRNEKDAKRMKEIKSKSERLFDEKSSLESKIESLQPKLDPEIEKRWEKYQLHSSKIQKHENHISRLKVQISSLENDKREREDEIQEIEDKVRRYKKVKKDVEKNKEVQARLEDLQSQLSQVESDMDKLEDKIREVHSQIKVLERDRDTIESNLEKIRGLSSKYKAYDCYMEAVKRDGVPYELISRYIPEIEQDINAILGQMVEFAIMLDVDGKNINASIVYDEDNIWALELGSGMEKFISSLAIRASLINLSNLPRPNFLAIDEGFGNLDSENMNSVYMLFDYLKAHFDFIVTISHIDVMRDMTDNVMNIQKDDGFSHVSYT